MKFIKTVIALSLVYSAPSFAMSKQRTETSPQGSTASETKTWKKGDEAGALGDTSGESQISNEVSAKKPGAVAPAPTLTTTSSTTGQPSAPMNSPNQQPTNREAAQAIKSGDKTPGKVEPSAQVAKRSEVHRKANRRNAVKPGVETNEVNSPSHPNNSETNSTGSL